MQVNTNAHPGYSPDTLISNQDLNVQFGAADFCANTRSTETSMTRSLSIKAGRAATPTRAPARSSRPTK